MNSHQNSHSTRRTLSHISTGHSAVSQRVLSRIHTGHSAVKATGLSAVSHRTLSRQRTAEYPSKHRLTALIFKHRLNLSGLILQVDCFKHSDAASSAPAARGLVERLVTVEDKRKSYRDLRP